MAGLPAPKSSGESRSREKLLEVMEGKKINWQYVGGHVGIAGNER